jgi:hypothetical protein
MAVRQGWLFISYESHCVEHRYLAWARSKKVFRYSQSGEHLRCIPVYSNLLSALSGATESVSSHHAILIWRRNRNLREFTADMTSPIVTEVAECADFAMGHLLDRAKIALKHPDTSKDEEQALHTLDLAQAACKTLKNLGLHGSAAQSSLRSSGTVDLCFRIITAIQQYKTRHNDQASGVPALACAVSTLRLMSTVAGQAEEGSVHGVPIVYDVLRSHLSQPSIQQEGLQLLHALCRTNSGANELDGVPGSWQWLGRAQLVSTRNIKKKHSWTGSKQGNNIFKNWNAARFASYLNLRGLKQGYCSDLQRNLDYIAFMALLPFEDEAAASWLKRANAFGNRNCVLLKLPQANCVIRGN